MSKTNLEKKLYEIARESIFEIGERGDLEAHNSDSEDFFETPVWSLKEALLKAYELGRQSR